MLILGGTMVIKSFIKTSLVDYPGHIATTVFTGGCNMRCPFCHNKDLVIENSNEFIPLNEFFNYIKKRRSMLEGVCITGGEPTLQNDLMDFIQQIKSYHLKIKLDTNGLKPSIIQDLLNLNLLDYIAMDIKNNLPKYELSTGIAGDVLTRIIQSVNVIRSSGIEYEFRTTVVRELHTKEDLLNIAQWLNGSKRYYLQQYKESETQLSNQIFTSYTADEMNEFKTLLLPYFETVDLRNI